MGESAIFSALSWKSSLKVECLLSVNYAYCDIRPVRESMARQVQWCLFSELPMINSHQQIQKHSLQFVSWLYNRKAVFLFH